MLDIIITHYREEWEIGKPAFDMLALQRGVSPSLFRVILVHDGGFAFPNEYFSGYPFVVEQLVIPHAGVSAARNAGLLHSRAEWVNFCDFDDMYSNVYALQNIFTALQTKKHDFLRAEIITEDFAAIPPRMYVTPEISTYVFIHAKYYRRQWLVDSGIRFDPEFSFQEDSLFNAIVLANVPTERIGIIKTPFPPYIWARRGGSVTNSQPNEDRATWAHFRRNWKVTEYYRDHLGGERLRDMVVRSVYDAYFMVNSKRGISPQMREQITTATQEYLHEFGQYYARPNCDTLPKIEEISASELMDIQTPHDFGIVTLWKNIQERTCK